MLICSLKINILLWLAKSSHEWRSPRSFHNIFIIDIVVFPSLLKSLLKVIVDLLSFLSKMRANDLSRKFLGLVLGDEELSAWEAFLSDSFGGVVLNHVSLERVHWSVPSFQVAWEYSIVLVLPLAVEVVVADEAVETGWETLESRGRLLNSTHVGKGLWLLVKVVMPHLNLLWLFWLFLILGIG